MPPRVDKEELLGRWGKALSHGGAVLHPESGIVPKAEHDVGGDSDDALNARKDLVRRVTGYLEDVVGLRKEGGTDRGAVGSEVASGGRWFDRCRYTRARTPLRNVIIVEADGTRCHIKPPRGIVVSQLRISTL